MPVGRFIVKGRRRNDAIWLAVIGLMCNRRERPFDVLIEDQYFNGYRGVPPFVLRLLYADFCLSPVVV